MTHPIVRLLLPLFAALLPALLVGCADSPPQLMPTPNLYARNGIDPFPNVAPQHRSSKVEVLYVTDRAYAEDSTPAEPKYGSKRSRSVVFGVGEVEFGNNVSWEQLVAASTTSERAVSLPVRLNKVTEIVRFPKTPRTLIELPPPPGTAVAIATGTLAEPPFDPELHEALNRCRAELSARLAHSDTKDVYVFVHGVKTEFPSSVTTAAEMWHFLGREGVAVAYSWPAGGKGLLRGYNYDYNSSEFTVYHLKETLKAITGCADVRKVHIIAHSRGTDVAINALRELQLEISASGRDTRQVLKLGTVVLAAADLDVDVVMQRAATSRLAKVPERTVVYLNSSDEALGISRWLFGGARLGKLQPDIFSHEELAALRNNPNLSFVDARVSKSGAFGHDYFYSNPAVSSDVVLALRYGKSAGAANGRPLKVQESGFWEINDNYPANLPAEQPPRHPAPAPAAK